MAEPKKRRARRAPDVRLLIAGELLRHINYALDHRRGGDVDELGRKIAAAVVSGVDLRMMAVATGATDGEVLASCFRLLSTADGVL